MPLDGRCHIQGKSDVAECYKDCLPDIGKLNLGPSAERRLTGNAQHLVCMAAWFLFVLAHTTRLDIVDHIPRALDESGGGEDEADDTGIDNADSLEKTQTTVSKFF